MIELRYVYLTLLFTLLLIFILLFRTIMKKHHHHTKIQFFGVDIDSFLWLTLFIFLNIGLVFLLYYSMLALSRVI